MNLTELLNQKIELSDLLGEPQQFEKQAKPFKVVHLCMQDFGGAGKAAYRLHKGLQSIGIDSTMLVLNKKSADSSVKVLPIDYSNNIVKCLDIPVYDSPVWKEQSKRWRKLTTAYPDRPIGLEMFTDAKSSIRLDRIQEIREADIINFHWIAGVVDYSNAISFLKNKTIVWTLHDMNPFTGGCHYAGNCLKYKISCGACPQLGSNNTKDLSQQIWKQRFNTYKHLKIHIVALSRWLAQCARESALFSRFPINLIPNGFPLDIFKPYSKSEARRSLNISESPKLILFGADSVTNQRKGFAYLLEALNRFSLKNGGDCLLVTFGYLSPEIKITSKYPVLNLGKIQNEKQLALIYSAADVFVLPSLEDNLPNTVIESMACGLPVVGFNIGGVPDMIEHKKTGYLAKDRDINGLIAGLNWVLSSYDKGADFSKQCREKVVKEYSLEVQAKAYNKLYNQILADKSGKENKSKSKTNNLQHSVINRILWIRSDSIGDNILAASMLPHIRKKYKNAEITVVCQEHITELYENCPFIDNIIGFHRTPAFENKNYQIEIINKLQSIQADILLNSVYSREPLTDALCIGSAAKKSIAFNGDLNSISSETRDKHNQYYSQILQSNEEHKSELERYKDFLKNIDIDVPLLRPIIWINEEDEIVARDFFLKNNLQPERTITLFAGSQINIRNYEQYGIALSRVCKAYNFKVIALGVEDDYLINQHNLDAIGVPTLNLCGKTTIRQSAALLKRCRLAVGAETGLAHISCAVNTPNVILLGGGHFGRFMPYSNLTSIVCLPLECYDCNWRCKYNIPYCIKDILPEVMTKAVSQTLEQGSKKPRVFYQHNSLWNFNKLQPQWKLFDKLLNINSVDSIEISDRADINMVDILNKAGEEFFKAGNFDDALKKFKQAVKINNNSVISHNNLGVLYWQNENIKKALKHFEKALEIDPDDLSTTLNCGEIFKFYDRVEDAKAIYSSYLEKNPNEDIIIRALKDLIVLNK
ncbi:hypothetical protein GMMP15_1550002 [Candidatus Magnetomoraceae bacterium gMMP-15]